MMLMLIVRFDLALEMDDGMLDDCKDTILTTCYDGMLYGGLDRHVSWTGTCDIWHGAGTRYGVR